MFGFVEYAPYGWRSRYLVGLVPLILLAYWRRSLQETQRFQAVEHVHEPVMKNIGNLFSDVPCRTIGLFGVVAGLADAASTAAFLHPSIYRMFMVGNLPASRFLTSREVLWR